jgi:hypothetical protein
MAGPAGHVAEDVVLVEDELLGEEVHLVCCAWQTRLGKIVSICGLDVTGAPFEPEDGATCTTCIEGDHADPRCRTQPWCMSFPGPS